MKTQKNSNSPSKKTKRTSMRRRKVKKVKLDKNKVTLLCGIIFLICCVCIAVNVLSQSAKAKNIAEIAKSEKKATYSLHFSQKIPTLRQLLIDNLRSTL